MPNAIALTIGLNAVDPRHYQGWSGELTACEADALDMTAIAGSRGFKTATLLTGEAKRSAVTKVLADAAATLKADDIFMLSYSGHGGQLPDLNDDEDDGQDETWCLYDGELIDDEIYAALGAFAAGVRILVFSDSCHSGTVVKAAFYADRSVATRSLSYEAGSNPAKVTYRAMPAQVAARTYQANRELYDPLLKDENLREARGKVKASALLISGCQDNQLSADGTFNGLFTGTLKRVWNGGKFKRSYSRFHAAIVDLMPPDQTPNYFTIGAHNVRFERQKPFAV
jgi:hypothetical protein